MLKQICFLSLITTLIFGCSSNQKPEPTPPTLPKKVTVLLTPNSSIRAIETKGENEVWWAGSNGNYGYTKDGGKTWTIDSIVMDTIKPQFRALAITDSAVLLMSIASPAYVFRTINSGETWDTVYKETHPKAFYNCLKFYNNQIGIAVGDATDSCMSIIRTEDGGKTWVKSPCTDQLKVAVGEANFAASNTNISIHKNHCWIATGGKKTRVFYSNDYGLNWSNYRTPMVQGKTMTGIYSVDFYDAKNGVLIGGDWENKELNDSNKAITKDGGKTWQLLANKQPPDYQSCVQFHPSNKSTLISSGSIGMYLSTNSGTSWDTLTTNGFYTTRFNQSGNKIWVAGKNVVGAISLD